MAEARKIAKYTFDALLVFVPLAVVLYFLAYPDKIQCLPELDIRPPMRTPRADISAREGGTGD